MILYIQNKAYPGRTFIELCSASDTVARVRSNILHRLHEIGHAHHQFRLKYKGSYLRDAYTLEEYKILNNAIISMVPLDSVNEWNTNMMLTMNKNEEEEDEAEDIVMATLQSEIQLLDKREKILNYYKTFLAAQIIVAFLGFFTLYWYFSFGYLLVLFLSIVFGPTYSRVGGWIGKSSFRRCEYMVAMLVLSTLVLVAGIALLALAIVDISSSAFPTDRCIHSTAICVNSAANIIEENVCSAYQSRCYETTVWSCIYYALVIVLMATMIAFCAYLLENFKFKTGDLIEKYLIETRELDQVLEKARHGNASQKRTAGFELSTMAASSDDNKFHIVREGGLEVLISIALSEDATTQEYATEALSECLTIPAIQDQFVTIGGVRTLTALLHAKHARTVKEALSALSYIVADSDENKASVVAHQGLDDLAHACKYAKSEDRKTLASMFLELAYYDETRNALCSRNLPSKSIVDLLLRSMSGDGIQGVDLDTTVLALQALEIIAIHSPSTILVQENLLNYLLELASKTTNIKAQQLAIKLVFYYAQDSEARNVLCTTGDLLDHLVYFAQSNDHEINKVLALISLNVSRPYIHRDRLLRNGFVEFLQFMMNSCSDEKDIWNMLDQALTKLQSTDQDDDDDDDDVTTTKIRSSSQEALDDVTLQNIRQRNTFMISDGGAGTSAGGVE